MILVYHDLGHVGFQGVDLQSYGIPTVDELVSRYAEQMNITGIAQKWSFYLAFICYRMAAILQGVYKRFTLGMFVYYFII